MSSAFEVGIDVEDLSVTYPVGDHADDGHDGHAEPAGARDAAHLVRSDG
jgi:hypothetical protein